MKNFIKNLKNSEITLTSSYSGHCGIEIKDSWLDFDFDIQISYSSYFDDNQISGINYWNAKITTKDGENETLLVLEDTDFDKAFEQYVFNNPEKFISI